MTAEYVHARIAGDSAEVECLFFLLNKGPATKVKVGFPCTSDGADVQSAVPFRSFRSYVDGAPVSVTVVLDTTASDASMQHFRAWWVKDVQFEAGEFKCLREVYVAEPGFSYPNVQSFEYELSTGGTWLGPIGVGDVVITFVDVDADSVSAQPQPSFRDARELRWHFERLDPGSTQGISTSW